MRFQAAPVEPAVIGTVWPCCLVNPAIFRHRPSPGPTIDDIEISPLTKLILKYTVYTVYEQ